MLSYFNSLILPEGATRKSLKQSGRIAAKHPTPRQRGQAQKTLKSFEYSGYTLASAHTGGNHSIALVLPLQFVEQLNSKLCSGATQRMAECYGAAVYIYHFRIEGKFLHYGKGLRSKGFIEFNQFQL